MYTEKGLLKQATFYSKKNSKYSLNFVDNKCYASKQVKKRRDFEIKMSPRESMIGTESSNRMAMTAKGKQNFNNTFFNTTINKVTPKKRIMRNMYMTYAQRPTSEDLSVPTNLK